MDFHSVTTTLQLVDLKKGTSRFQAEAAEGALHPPLRSDFGPGLNVRSQNGDCQDP